LINLGAAAVSRAPKPSIVGRHTSFCEKLLDFDFVETFSEPSEFCIRLRRLKNLLRGCSA